MPLRDHPAVRQFGPRESDAAPYEVAGTTWYPFAEVSGRDGETVSCTGPGLERIQITWDYPFNVRLGAIAGAVGTVLGGVFAAIAWAMRRHAFAAQTAAPAHPVPGLPPHRQP